jgi:phosphatidylserine/phosphatidylglycerophosphate/cardiolipin synthase-like enzyme
VPRRGIRYRKLISLAGILVVIFLLALYALFHIQSLPKPTPIPSDAIPGGGWYTVYFTDPTDPSTSTLRGGLDSNLAKDIEEARYSVDIAIYRLDLWSVRDALIRAHRRGVTVRMITESDHILEAEIEDLEAAGIPVLGDRREHLMHHKFVVIDGLVVWTGSMNFTVSGAYRNHNNLIRIRSNRVAQNYTREFEEMFVEDRFGALSKPNTPYPKVTVDGVPIEIYFSPDDSVAARLVDFLAYTFTSDIMAEVMIARAQTGVVVRGVVERSQASNPGSEYQRLRHAGLDIRLDSNPANMHHKVIIVDGVLVITGSYNFSHTAEESNDENVIILYDVDVGTEYLLEFKHVFEAATP